MNLIKWLCLAVMLLPVALAAQSGRRFTTYSVNEGLSQSTIYKAYQDLKGYMWFSVDNGLNRFDGWEIKSYSRPAGGRRAQPQGSNLCEDNTGRIWYSDATGVYCCDPYKNKIERVATPKIGKSIRDLRSIFIDKAQCLWLFSKDTGIVCYHIDKKNFSYFPKTVDLTFGPQALNQTPVVDGNSNIWFVGPDAGVYSFNTNKFIYNHHKFSEPVKNLLFEFSRFYIQTYSNLYFGSSIDEYAISKIPLALPQNTEFEIESLVRDAYNRIWISTSNQGLICLDSNKTKVYRQALSDPFSLPVDRLTDLLIDRSNNLWIGTKGGGVIKMDIKPPFFEIFPNPERPAKTSYDFSARCFWEDENGFVWFGSQNDGLSIFDPLTNTLQTIPLPPETDPDVSPCNQVNHIFRDARNNIWISHCRGLAIVDAGRKKLNPVSLTAAISDKRNQAVFRVIQLKNGEWLAATARGLVSIRPADQPGVFRTNMALGTEPGGNTWTGFLEMKDGTLWVSSPDGLTQYEWQADYTLKQKGHFLSNTELYCLYPGANPLVWLSSVSGLLLFDSQKKDYQQPVPELKRAAYSILEDQRRNLWLQTDREIIRIDSARDRWYAFSMKHIVGNNEFSPGAFYRSPSGYFYVGGNKGFVRFNPEESIKNEGRRFLADITEIRVNGTSINTDSNSILSQKGLLVFPSNQNDLEVRFAALDFTDPQANKIECKLEGWDDEWRPAFQHEARYTNLEKGYYTLRVRACNALGVWSKEQKVLIQISAPFWYETWFAILCFVIFMAGSYWLMWRNYRRQMDIAERRQRAILAERERIAKDMHDEIGGGLSRIALMTELIEPKLAKNPQTQERVQEIARSARKLVQTMNEIVWALNPHNNRLDHLLAYMREQSHQFFEPFESVQFRIDFPDEIPENVELSNQQRRNLYLVAKESLNNALKHANATRVELRMGLNGKALHFEVRDNGKGIPEENAGLKKGLGLTSMRKRMAEINGSIRWEKISPQGTAVVFSIPLAEMDRIA